MCALILLMLCSPAFVAVAKDGQEETMPSREAEMASVSLLQVHASFIPSMLQYDTSEVASSWQDQALTTGTSTGMLSTWQEAFKEDPALFDGCSKVFVDVGANRGTHVRKLFEPLKYPGSEYLAVFNEGFGSSRSGTFSETGICAFGFEANPRWASRLKRLEKAYGAQGWRTKFFAPTAVSDKAGNVTFYLNDVNGTNSDWGASMTKHNPLAKVRKVPAIDLSGFMQQLSARALPGYKLMKMDIEGAEFIVLPKLLETNMLCKSVLDKLTIEWHETAIADPNERAAANRTHQQVVSPTKCGGQPATMVVAFDDESYLKDGMPLP